MSQSDIEKLINQLLNGEMPALSKAITIIESEHDKHRNSQKLLLKSCLPKSGKSIRIGISGVPGVGKSTFIESLGNLLSQKGKKIAILAVDPSSKQNKGSILGDKTRMETLVQNPAVFVRPSPTGSHLGGVAKKTRESIILCEAAGYDIILIETVGVGQSETAVASMVDFFLLLQLAGAGDELQGMKRGIMELCDAIVINKADGDNIKAAKLAQQEYKNALHLFAQKENEWTPRVMTCSAVENKGIFEVWEIIQEFVYLTQTNGTFHKNRDTQEVNWLYELLNQEILKTYYSNTEFKTALDQELALLRQKKTTPYEVVLRLLKK
jgi:LAO/AO transport system kinase